MAFHVRERAVTQHSIIISYLHFFHLPRQISMERRPTLYVLNLILPTCALYLLDMAVLFGPSSLEEKISFQISIILGSSMLAVILNNMLPTSSNEPPIIGIHLYRIKTTDFYTKRKATGHLWTHKRYQ